jgi:hypothetical protein
MVKQSKKKKSGKTRIDANGAERTIQHLSLPDDVVGEMRRIANKRGRLVGETWDLACTAFVEQVTEAPFRQYVWPHKSKPPEKDYRAIWIDSRVLEKCRAIARRDEMSDARVIHTAAVFFLASQKK